MRRVCASHNCHDSAADDDVYCGRCREEIDAMPQKLPRPINRWAVFAVFAVIAAYGALMWRWHR